MSLIGELQRRNVFRVAMLYVIVSWLVLQVGDILVPVLVLPESALRIVFFLLLLGFLPTMVFAWAYEITPEGIKREREVERSQSITAQTARRLNLLIAVLLATAVVLLSIDLLRQQESSAPAATPAANGATTADEPISVAVLPFVNISSDPDNEYFSDGISEELLNVLMKVEGLRVPSRTSSFSFKGEDRPLAEIAAALGVRHVLEGSVRKAGSTVRISAQLIDVDSDSPLWADTFDRELTDIFALQDDIASAIVRALTDALVADSLQVQAPTDSLEAYQAYLRGRQLWWKRYGDSVPRAIELLERAVSLDPGFARAWSGLAAAYAVLPTYTDSRAEDTNLRATAAAERALALDPDLGEAHAVQAMMHYYAGRFVEASRAFENALAVDPTDVLARAWFGLFLTATGYYSEARETFLSILELDPINGFAHAHLGLSSEALGEREAALRYAEQGEEDGLVFASMVRYEIAMQEGRYGDAMEVVRRFLAAYDNVNPCLDLIEAALLGTVAKAQAVACLRGRASFGDGSDWYLPEFDLELVDETLARLDPDRVPSPYYQQLQWIWGPRGAFLRKSPEFQAYVERVGLLDLWRERGWPDACGSAPGGFDCN